MAENTEQAISIDEKVANTLASQLANENLQLRQAQIRLGLEVEQLRTENEELKAATEKAKSSKK